jgi:hypothetical protein
MLDNTSREDAYIARIVADAPAFTQSQLARLIELFADDSGDQ